MSHKLWPYFCAWRHSNYSILFLFLSNHFSLVTGFLRMKNFILNKRDVWTCTLEASNAILLFDEWVSVQFPPSSIADCTRSAEKKFSFFFERVSLQVALFLKLRIEDVDFLAAILSLDNLGNQISQFVSSTSNGDEFVKGFKLVNQEALKDSLLRMRVLLMDAQTQFSDMAENKKQLATKIDGSISSVSAEVDVVKAELRRLSSITSEHGEGLNFFNCLIFSRNIFWRSSNF